MSRRLISWSAALRDIRADRGQSAPCERRTYIRQQTFANLAASRAGAAGQTRPLFAAGAYDLRAIMSVAVEAAKARRAVTNEHWSVCLSAALTGTWRAAKAARHRAMLQEQFRVQRLLERSGGVSLRKLKVPDIKANEIKRNASAVILTAPTHLHRQPSVHCDRSGPLANIDLSSDH